MSNSKIEEQLSQGYLEVTDDWHTQLYAETDSPDGIMITIDVDERTSQGTCHLSREEALALAKLILSTQS